MSCPGSTSSKTCTFRSLPVVVVVVAAVAVVAIVDRLGPPLTGCDNTD